MITNYIKLRLTPEQRHMGKKQLFKNTAIWFLNLTWLEDLNAATESYLLDIA